MTSARIPGGSWTWRRTALVLAVVLLPVLGLVILGDEDGRSASAARVDGMIVVSAALVSAIGCYAAWRINPRPALAWASFAATLLGCQRLLLTAGPVSDARGAVQGLSLLTADLVVALVVLFAVTVGQSLRLRPDPIISGFVVGALLGLVRLGWIHGAPDLGAGVPQGPVTVLLVVVLLAAATAVLRNHTIALWSRQRFAVTILLLGGAHLALFLADDGTGQALALAADVLGAALLVSTSLALLFLEIDVDAESRSHLSDELERAQGRIRVHRAQFHEVNSTLAGITSASRLLRSTNGINEQRRRLLEDMVIAELGRLERLMARQTDASRPRRVDLDEVISHLVVSREARGHRVVWSPSALAVNAQADAVAEVINILLDNAARHGASVAEVCARRVGDTVEVAVHDDGPGIEEPLRRSIFEWGARGARSTGQGIGLHIAHELMQRQGGYLEIRDSPRGGATFVLGLPAAPAHASDPENQDDGNEPAADRA